MFMKKLLPLHTQKRPNQINNCTNIMNLKTIETTIYLKNKLKFKIEIIQDPNKWQIPSTPVFFFFFLISSGETTYIYVDSIAPIYLYYFKEKYYANNIFTTL